jgi:hypothetical protein
MDKVGKICPEGWTCREPRNREGDSSNEITTSTGPVHDVNRKPNEACGLVQCKDGHLDGERR